MSMDGRNNHTMATAPITLDLMVRHNISLLAAGLIKELVNQARSK